MDDLIGEALMYIFGPIIVVVAVIAMISIGFTHAYNWFTGTKPVVEEYHAPVEKETLSHKAGHAVKESGKEFIRGFFSK